VSARLTVESNPLAQTFKLKSIHLSFTRVIVESMHLC
jgi:hypothetical protein